MIGCQDPKWIITVHPSCVVFAIFVDNFKSLLEIFDRGETTSFQDN